MGEVVALLDRPKLPEAPVSQETERHPFFQLRLNIEDPALVDSDESISARRYIHNLNRVARWAGLNASRPLDRPSSKIKDINKVEGEIKNPDNDFLSELVLEAKGILGLLVLTTEKAKISSNSPDSSNFDEDLSEDKEENLMGVGDEDCEYFTLTIKNKSEFRRFFRKIARSAHDLKGGLTSIIGNAQLIQRKNNNWDKCILGVKNGYIKMHERLRSKFQEITDNEEQYMPVNLELLKRIFLSTSKSVLIDRDFDEKNIFINIGDVPDNISLPVPFLRGLVENIAINSANICDARRIIDKRFTVIVRFLEEQGMVEILCEDNGPGYPVEIIENGFMLASDKRIGGYRTESGRRSRSNRVISTGNGMELLTEDIRDKELGGDLIPKNKMDENGNILGAQTIIRVPYKKGV